MKYIYSPPDFAQLDSCDAQFEPAPRDGVAPERYYTSTNFPTYVRREGTWQLVRRARMDCAVVLRPSGDLECVEARNLRMGELVLVGQAPLAPMEEAWKKRISEDGKEGIYTHEDGFHAADETGDESGEFAFMIGSVSPEYPVEHEMLADLVEAQRRIAGGYSIWVVGPAVVHSGGRQALQWLIEHGYVGALLSGNGFAAHDIEMAMLGTSLGRGAKGGHRHHLAALNKVRELGSIRAAIEAGLIRDGVLYACDRHDIPVVLTGSIRDDGPLPEVICDSREAQDKMREQTVRATLAVMLASVLHSVGTGNMLPTFIERDGSIEPVDVIAVDADQFAVTKLVDRGTHQAYGVVRNADDFLRGLVATLKRRQATDGGAE